MNGLLNFKKRSKVVTEDESKAASHYRPKGNGNFSSKNASSTDVDGPFSSN